MYVNCYEDMFGNKDQRSIHMGGQHLHKWVGRRQKRFLLLWMKEHNHRCLKTRCLGEYLDIRRMNWTILHNGGGAGGETSREARWGYDFASLKETGCEDGTASRSSPISALVSDVFNLRVQLAKRFKGCGQFLRRSHVCAVFFANYIQ
jgi:hypothetical protein